MRTATGTWLVLWQGSFAVFVLLVGEQRHLCWTECDSSCVTQLRAMETRPCPSFCQSTSVRNKWPENPPSPCFCHPQPCPTWNLRSKNRPIYVVSSSPWTKVKGFALTGSENTGLAWELTELSYYTAPVFQIQLLLILPYETFWKKRRNSAMGGTGHLFQAFYLAASVSIHFPPLKRERNIVLPVNTFNSLYLSCVSLENNNKC